MVARCQKQNKPVRCSKSRVSLPFRETRYRFGIQADFVQADFDYVTMCKSHSPCVC